MIGQIIVIVLAVGIVFILGMVCGQHSVWKILRKKGPVTINEWCYTAVKTNKKVTKHWD